MNDEELQYYELIIKRGVTMTVLGVTAGEEYLLNALTEDPINIVGVITKEEFDSYGDDPWISPKSTQMFRADIVSYVALKPL